MSIWIERVVAQMSIVCHIDVRVRIEASRARHAKSVEQIAGQVGHDRLEQNGGHAQRLEHEEEHLVERVRVLVSSALGQRPRLVLVHGLVGRAHIVHDRVNGRVKAKRLVVLGAERARLVQPLDERYVGLAKCRRDVRIARIGGGLTVHRIDAHERQATLVQVADGVGQLLVDALGEGDTMIAATAADVAVGVDGSLAQQKVAHAVARIVAQALDRVDDVADALGHLALVDEPVAVAHDTFGQRQAGRHQKRRPIDGVKAQYVLADNVCVSWPQTAALVRS